jgi:hypothetical protein
MQLLCGKVKGWILHINQNHVLFICLHSRINNVQDSYTATEFYDA